MPYNKMPKLEDVNADTRVKAPTVAAPAAPGIPQVPNPQGGAPKQKVGWWNEHVQKPKPWQGVAEPPPVDIAVASKPKWTLKDVAANEPAFVEEFQKVLWDRFQAVPEAERNSVFWQGVRQNPKLAAASFVRRALQNMADANNMMNGEKPPTLSEAMRTTVANNETRQWFPGRRATAKCRT